MNKKVTQMDVEADLKAATENRNYHQYEDNHESARRVFPIFDFSLPNRIQQEQIRTLNDLHDKISRTLSTKITALLNNSIDITFVGSDQMQYNEFTMSLSNPTSFNILTMKPLEGHAVLEINHNVASAAIDILLGGAGDEKQNPKDFTEIELEILQYLIKIILKELKYAWEPINIINFSLESKENSHNNIQIAAQNEVVVISTFHFKMKQEEGYIQICYPVIYLEPILSKLLSKTLLPSSYGKKTRHGEIKALLAGTEMDFEAILFEDQIDFEKLLNIKKGTIITSNINVTDPLIGRVNKKNKFKILYGEYNSFKGVKIMDLYTDEKNETVKVLKQIEKSRLSKYQKIIEEFEQTEKEIKEELK